MKIKLSELRKLIREAMNEQGERAGAVFGMPLIDDDDEDGMAAPGVASSDLRHASAEMVDIVASEIVDTMDSSSLDKGWFDSLLEDLMTDGQIDPDVWDAAGITYEEVKDRVIELEDEYGFDGDGDEYGFEGDSAEDRFAERVGEALTIAAEGGMDIDDIINLIADSLMDDMYGTGFDRASILKAMSSYVQAADAETSGPR
jgi:hypothetical protein